MYKKITLCIIAIITTILAICLPEIIINKQVDASLGTCIEAPAEYYDASSSAIAREMSTRLTDMEKLELISGNWNSETTMADISTTDYSEWEEIQLAKKSFSNLLNAELKSKSTSSNASASSNHAAGSITLSNMVDFDTWYSYETVMFKCTDTTFNTYSAYFFGITFTKYDKSEKYQLLMTDTGTIIYASNNIASDDYTGTIYDKYIELINSGSIDDFSTANDSNYILDDETIKDILSEITTNDTSDTLNKKTIGNILPEIYIDERGNFTYALIP
jgi:hypothetical protein